MDEGNFGFMVLSIGIATRLYEDLVDLLPEVEDVTVDIRQWIKAPHRSQRIRAVFPDERVKYQVKSSAGFEQALDACNRILRRFGIVVIGCKSGVHRAPTMSEIVQEQARNPYVVHCCVRNVSALEAAVLVRSCIHSRKFSTAIHAGQLVNMKRQICLGWKWYGYVGSLLDGAVPRGMKFEAIWPDEKYPGLVNVSFRSLSGHSTVSIDARWLIQEMIFESRYVPGGKTTAIIC